eukprot:SAG22_NODE_1902_length_3339_cov_2.045370_2_plen_89_part_00
MAASKAAVRYQSAADSTEVCQLSKGEVVTVTHTKEIKSEGKTITRLRFKLGWVSQINSGGYTLMIVSSPQPLYLTFQKTPKCVKMHIK